MGKKTDREWEKSKEDETSECAIPLSVLRERERGKLNPSN